MKLYLCMAAEGSCAFLLYLLLKKGFTRELSLKWRSRFLRINVLLYLIPVPWFVAEIKARLRTALEKAGMTFRDGEISAIDYPDTIWGSTIIKNAEGRIVYITGYQRYLPLILLGFFLFAVLIAAWIIAYIKLSRQYKRDAVCIEDGKIKIAVSPHLHSPVTIGFFKSTILLPEGGIQKGVVQHERAHAENRDGIFRFLSYVVIATQWYNPLCYFLLREMIAVSEMYCDEKATEAMTKEEKADYMRCMIASAEKKTRLVAMNLGAEKGLTKKRMMKIMGKNQKKVMKNAFAAGIVAVCFLISGIPALAYKKPITNSYEENVQDRNFGGFDVSVFVPEGETLPYEVPVQTKAGCIHNYEAGTCLEHDKQSNGSCAVTTYNAKRCRKCGHFELGSKISTLNYGVCPHETRISRGSAEID